LEIVGDVTVFEIY